MEKHAIGIDLGGTNIKGIVMGRSGKGRHLTRIPTEAEKGGARVLDNILTLIDKLLVLEKKQENITGVGIVVPGFVSDDGIASGAANLPGWEGINLYGAVKSRFGMQAVAANDATIMAFAEAKFGAGRGVRNVVCYALGTGIGGGIVVEHKLYKGKNGMAGELGHIVVEPGGIRCNCGQSGCLERYASASGIVAMAKSMAAEKQGADISPFVKICCAGPGALTSKIVYEYVAHGDPIACAVNDCACDMLARGIGGVINTLAPDRIVLGGGVMMAGQIIIDTVKKHLPRYALPQMLGQCAVVAAELGEDAGVIGAAAMALDEFDA